MFLLFCSKEKFQKFLNFKIIFCFYLLQITVFNVFSQNFSIIGQGSFGSGAIPIYTGSPYSLSQTIYPSNLLISNGMVPGSLITSIAWYVNAPDSSTFNSSWSIYLANTSQSSFNSTSSWVPNNFFTNVFSGTVVAYPAGWKTINLSTPFIWNGSNLVIAVDENSPENSPSPNLFLRSYLDYNTNISIYKGNNSNISVNAPGTATGILLDYPNVKIGWSSSTPSEIISSTHSICSIGQSSTLSISGSVVTTYWFAGTCGNSTTTSIGSGTSLVVYPTSTTTYYARNYSNGIWSDNCASTTITVDIASPPNNPTSNSPQCSSLTITRSGTPPSGTTWYWQGTNADGTSTNLGSGSTYTASSSGTYYIRAQNSSGCWSSTSGSTYVTLLPLPNTPATPTSNSPQCTFVTITQSGTPPWGVNWYWQGTDANGTSTSLGSDLTYIASNSGSYYIRAQDSSGCWSDSSAGIQVIRECELKIPSAISPNGDDYNDTWDIVGIDEIKDFKIQIFDLSGNMVYAQFGTETNGIYTPFVGKNNNDVDIIDGDYIYSFKSKNKDMKYSGILTIKRK